MATKDDSNDDAMVVTLTNRQLKHLLREVVRAEMQVPVPPEYMSTEQVAELIGCTVESIRNYSARAGLPCVRIGKIRRFCREDVLAWLEERRSRPGTQKAKHSASIARIHQLK